MKPATDFVPEEAVRTPQDYLVLVKRRRLLLFSVFAAVFLASIAVAVVLPPVYRSVATILIEEPEVPPELVESTVTSYADQRIQMIKYRVMSSQNLTKIINRFDLYRELRRTAPLAQIIERFREDIEVETIEARVLNPRNGRATQATIAFTLGYNSAVPYQAQRVANELVTLFLAENTRERQGQTAATTAFLTQESERLATRVKDLETKIAEFKQKNAGRLPQQLEFNLDNIDRTQRDLAQIDRRIDGLKERRDFLVTELRMVSAGLTADAGSLPGAGSPWQRLVQLREQLAALGKTLGPNHPQLISLKHEVAALEASLNGDSGATASRLTPPVQSMRLAVLREADAAESAVPLNPIYLQLRSQLKTTNVELVELESERQSLNERLKVYERRIMEAPDIERIYQGLVRDYDNATRKYNETRDKQLAAELSQALETERKSERFVLIEPPQLPTRPGGPGKLLIVLAGFVLASASGVGLVALSDLFDGRIHTPRQLAAVTGEMPLQVVPYIQTPAERWRAIGLRVFLSLLAIAIVAGVLAAVHYLMTPLDVMWSRIVAMVQSNVQVPRL